MRYIIAAATAFVLIVGVAVGFALTATVFEAEAKPPPVVQPGEEQKLNASGFIAVHEQGTADVNVVSTVPSTGRLVTLAFTGGLSQFVDTSDCSHISILARDSTDIASLKLFASPDGTARIEFGSPTFVRAGGVDGFVTLSVNNLPLAEPFMQVQITKAPNLSGWIWCAP